MKIYFDSEKKRLIYLNKKATPEFWDDFWDLNTLKGKNLSKRNKWIVDLTKKYLREDNQKVLEGGCGKGDKVFALKEAGFQSYGLDFAKNTVKEINTILPELKVVCGDVREVPFENGFFDAYWSIGVIEHFWYGYQKILNEANRVLKKGSFLFITFPSINLLRKIKAFFGFYPIYKDKNGSEPEGFYQFALDPDQVIKDLKLIGFNINESFYVNPVKGLKDDVNLFRKILGHTQKNSHRFYAKFINKILKIIFKNISGHSIVIVAQKKSDI